MSALTNPEATSRHRMMYRGIQAWNKRWVTGCHWKADLDKTVFRSITTCVVNLDVIWTCRPMKKKQGVKHH